MKCINKIISIILCFCLVISFTACSKEKNAQYTSYSLYDTSFAYGITNNGTTSNISYYAKDLCIAGEDDIGTEAVDSQVASSAGAFNITTNTVLYAQSMHEQIYPASTTKIMTCYVACLYGNMDDYYTVSENAVNQSSDSSVCNLKAGDTISLRDLLYGLMLRSGNDAAIAIAEGISGDVETFVSLMNDTAQSLGATNTNYVTPNGLHDENHYTSVYDMYLILNAALQNETFYTIFTSTYYTASLTRGGSPQTLEWTSTNQYLNGNATAPNGISVLGGKTGTTGAAGYCLALLSENENHDKILSFVYNADCRSNLYLLMNEILSQYCL